jgi:cell fate regulator YaaT (PSP1 superfamily)
MSDDEYPVDEIDAEMALFEDEADEEAEPVIDESAESMIELNGDVPVYRLTIPYSRESFHAAYKGDPISKGTMVLVPTRYGKDMACVKAVARHEGGNNRLSRIVWIDRLATEEDLERAKTLRCKEEKAFTICQGKISDHDLNMKLVSAHYLPDELKIIFSFTSENRVDFRDLVKDLVSVFKARIELRQIGIRDEARILGGLGLCGRDYCCHAISDRIRPVSIKMAKDQNLSLNSMKISGPCGRLLCCLGYEHNFYSEQRRMVPQEGAKVTYDGATWRVTEVNVVVGLITMAAEDGRQTRLNKTLFEKSEGRWRVVQKSAGE